MPPFAMAIRHEQEEKMTTDEWLDLFRKEATDFKSCTRLILEHIDGYGVEYGFDVDADARDLFNAYAALNLWALRHMEGKLPSEMQKSCEQSVTKINEIYMKAAREP
jgi:hypothetical protein